MSNPVRNSDTSRQRFPLQSCLFLLQNHRYQFRQLRFGDAGLPRFLDYLFQLFLCAVQQVFPFRVLVHRQHETSFAVDCRNEALLLQQIVGLFDGERAGLDLLRQHPHRRQRLVLLQTLFQNQRFDLIHQLLIDRYHRIVLNDNFHCKRRPLSFDKQYITEINRCKGITTYQLRLGLFCRMRTSKKTITSDHSGFAGVQPPAIHPPPANIRSPDLR